MSPQYRRIVAAAAATVLILLPGLAFAVEARFDLSSPASSPFPSDRFTVDDHHQKTGLRVSLPKPRRPGRLSGEAFEDFLGDGKHKHHHGGGLGDYRGDLREALDKVEIHGHRTVAASVFTTLSATAVLEKIRREIKHSQPKPATVLGTFPLINLNPRSIQWRREVRKFPNPKDPTDPLFVFSTFPVAALGIIPGVGSVAFGSFESPDWELMP